MKQAKAKPYGGVGRYEAGPEAVSKKMPWYKKVLWLIVTLLGVEMVNLALWQLGAISDCLSLFISEILTGVIAFLVGRIYEKVNK